MNVRKLDDCDDSDDHSTWTDNIVGVPEIGQVKQELVECGISTEELPGTSSTLPSSRPVLQGGSTKSSHQLFYIIIS